MRLAQDLQNSSPGEIPGLAQAIDIVDVLLQQHFALAERKTNPNELPDRVDLR